MISITIDTEWCAKQVIEDTLNLLNERGIDATLFSTHDDELSVSHERALHPNFLKEDTSEQEIMRELSDIYPEAEGVRSHSLYIHSGLRNKYPERIKYESNYISYLEESITPFWMLNEVVQIPVFFMDDMWLRTRSSDSLGVTDIVKGEGVKVFDFHPIHIYLNTPDIEYYTENKKHYENPRKLRGNRYEGFGVRDLFTGLLDNINESGLKACTMADIAEKYQKENPYSGIKL